MKPPFYGTKVVTDIKLDDVYPLIDKNFLFKGQWQFKKNSQSEEAYQSILRDKAYPVFDEWKRRCRDEKILEPKVVYGNFKRVEIDHVLHVPRSTFHETVPLQLVTVGDTVVKKCQWLYASHSYTDYLYLHGLAVATTEALAEYWHRKILRELGIPFNAGKPLPPMSRISPGYPVWPDLKDQMELCRLLGADRIGVTLTETHQLVPEYSTSAMICL